MRWLWATTKTVWESLRETYLDNLFTLQDNYDSPTDALFALLAEDDELLETLTTTDPANDNPFITYQAAKLNAKAKHLYYTTELRLAYEAVMANLNESYQTDSSETFVIFNNASQAAVDTYNNTNAQANADADEATEVNDITISGTTATSDKEPSVTKSEHSAGVKSEGPEADPVKEKEELMQKIRDAQNAFLYPGDYDKKGQKRKRPEDYQKKNFKYENLYPELPPTLYSGKGEANETKRFGQFQIAALKTPNNDETENNNPPPKHTTAVSIRYFPTQPVLDLIDSEEYQIRFIQVAKSLFKPAENPHSTQVTEFIKNYNKWVLDGADIERRGWTDSHYEDIFWRNNGFRQQKYATAVEKTSQKMINAGIGKGLYKDPKDATKKPEIYYYMMDVPGGATGNLSYYNVVFTTYVVLTTNNGDPDDDREDKIVAWLGVVQWEITNTRTWSGEWGSYIEVKFYGHLLSDDLYPQVTYPLLLGIQNKIKTDKENKRLGQVVKRSLPKNLDEYMYRPEDNDNKSQ